MTVSSSPDLRIYEAALRPPIPSLRRILKVLWTFAGLTGLVLLTWMDVFSAWVGLFWVPLVMVVRAVLLVETVGYAYHRFFQHLGTMTRRSQVFRRNQRYHWVHHMIIYPIGRFYRRSLPYVSSEEGVGWSWTVPALLAAGLALATKGFHLGTVIFIAGIGLYAKYVVGLTHERFHLVRHPWLNSLYFQWLEKIHVLHHWDQRTNFTIVHPFMDVLFGTYLSPANHKREIEVALEDEELTVSDVINWRYVLMEATPAEYAAFITTARRHPRSIRKVERILELLRLRLERLPEDDQARELHSRALDLLRIIRLPDLVSQPQ